MNAIPNHPIHRQSGAALIVSLILLLVMTLLGVSAMQTNVLEEKMAGNFRDRDLAFQAAEAALRDGETDISLPGGRISGLSHFSTDCSDGLCDATTGFSDVWKDATKSSNSVTRGSYTGASTLAKVSQQPVYWIEGYKIRPPGSASWKYRYRITAIGYGGNPNTRVILQSVYSP